MKKATMLAMLAMMMLAALPANAQVAQAFCGDPRGCDCDGDFINDIPVNTDLRACQYLADAENPNGQQPNGSTTTPDFAFEPVTGDSSEEPQAPSSSDDFDPGISSDGDFDPGVSSGSAAPGSTGTASATYGALPDTGGASPIALGAGALLLAGAMAARRMIR